MLLSVLLELLPVSLLLLGLSFYSLLVDISLSLSMSSNVNASIVSCCLFTTVSALFVFSLFIIFFCGNLAPSSLLSQSSYSIK